LGVDLFSRAGGDQRNLQQALRAVRYGNGGVFEKRKGLMAGCEKTNNPGPVVVRGLRLALDVVDSEADVTAGSKDFAIRRINVARQTAFRDVPGFQD
jgi:hypothetical protein